MHREMFYRGIRAGNELPEVRLLIARLKLGKRSAHHSLLDRPNTKVNDVSDGMRAIINFAQTFANKRFDLKVQ